MAMMYICENRTHREEVILRIFILMYGHMLVRVYLMLEHSDILAARKLHSNITKPLNGFIIDIYRGI